MPRRKQDTEKSEGTPAPQPEPLSAPLETEQSASVQESKPKRRKTVKASSSQEEPAVLAPQPEQSAPAVKPKRTYRRKKIDAPAEEAAPAAGVAADTGMEESAPAPETSVTGVSQSELAKTQATASMPTPEQANSTPSAEPIKTPAVASSPVAGASLESAVVNASPIVQPASPSAQDLSAQAVATVTTHQAVPADFRPYGEHPRRPYVPGQKSVTPVSHSAAPGPRPFAMGTPSYAPGNRPPGHKPFRPGPRPFKPGGKPGGKPFFKKPGGAPRGSKRKIPPAVKELSQQHGLLLAAAFKVSRGLMTLEQALQEKAVSEERKQKASAICQQHPKINFALACLLIKENKTPEDYFAQKKERALLRVEKEKQKKERMRQDDNQSPAFSMLETYRCDKVSLELAMYDGKTLVGVIEDFTPYEFYFQPKGEQKKMSIHRLEIKYLCTEQEAPLVKKMMMVDKTIQAKKMHPTLGREGRYKFPEGLLKSGNEIILALHEGEIMRGPIVWCTPYDIMLQVGKQRVWIFCHAVTECALARKAINK